ncbi:MAG TPA: hypothetical protein VMT85_17615 [Thermoanaerobaculia bacterium]|nr:hypothetical protein [Thermoanaerobaculia bacterium]
MSNADPVALDVFAAGAWAPSGEFDVHGWSLFGIPADVDNDFWFVIFKRWALPAGAALSRRRFRPPG